MDRQSPARQCQVVSACKRKIELETSSVILLNLQVEDDETARRELIACLAKDSVECPSLGEETEALLGSRPVKSQRGFFHVFIRNQFNILWQ